MEAEPLSRLYLDYIRLDHNLSRPTHLVVTYSRNE